MTNDIEIQEEEIVNIFSISAGLRIKFTKNEEILKIIFSRYGLPEPEFTMSKKSAEILKQMLEEALKIK